MRWIDSHAHLSMFNDDEVPGVLDEASAVGVAGVLVPATGPGDLEVVLGLSRDFAGRIVAAVGVHPHEASALDATMKRRVEHAISADGVVAVGEIGLDYHYMSSPREDQLTAFAWQLDLAIEAGLPVIVHNRESWADLEGLLGARARRLRGVCHSFTEGPAEARRVVDLGVLVGISGMVTFKRADNIREMAAALELAEVLVETDSPYLAPVPHRGRRNQPAYVVEVGKRLAVEWGVEAETVAEATTRNFFDLFGAVW